MFYLTHFLPKRGEFSKIHQIQQLSLTNAGYDKNFCARRFTKSLSKTNVNYSLWEEKSFCLIKKTSTPNIHMFLFLHLNQ
ncbi:MAG: hypothetical protein CK425_05275 [Parachlamydia sp.]|nr:MAG: hypothetical protein CK425_05275 [Parachlamydia sp.]